MCRMCTFIGCLSALSSTEFVSQESDKHLLPKTFHVNKCIGWINIILTLVHLNKDRIFYKNHIKYTLVSSLLIIKQKCDV